MTGENESLSVPKALAAGGAVAGLEGMSYATLSRYGTGLDSMPSTVMEEFPGIDRDLLEKFSSFDPDLGWCPQPNRTKKKDTADHLPGEEVRHVVTYSTDEYASRVCPAAGSIHGEWTGLRPSQPNGGHENHARLARGAVHDL